MDYLSEEIQRINLGGLYVKERKGIFAMVGGSVIMDDLIDVDVKKYRELLKSYIETQDEQSLYRAEQISKTFLKKSVPPEEIVNMHNQALLELYPNLFKDFHYSMNFLLETMIFYGLAHQEVQTLRAEQSQLQSEISVAANMQDTFLATSKPNIEGLDIGVISIAAEQLNGDYYHFNKRSDGSLNVALADVIGKGIPAALCMSMIKYAMDILLEDSISPSGMLAALNRVVEKNVTSDMFITMFYGHYFPKEKKLTFSSAGHEPGYHFCAKDNKFKEIDTKGLVLGVLPNTKYKQYELTIEKDDMVVLLTDGVTECRSGDDFVEIEEVLNVIKDYGELSAQEIVDEVYKHFERLQNFQLRDDFSLIIFKK